MFIVNNKTITNAKTLDIGNERQATLSFDFPGMEFADTDTFALTYGSQSNANYSFTNDGKLKFVNVNFDFIENQETSVALTIVKNGSTEILDDTITVYAQVAGGGTDLSDYYTKEQTESLVNDNGIAINTANQATDTIALAYDASYGIQMVNLTSSGTTLTINPCTGYTPIAGKIPTFELWIKADTGKTTISISNSIQQIDADNMPEEIANDGVYVFVWRFVGNDQLLNFSHKFTENVTASGSEA